MAEKQKQAKSRKNCEGVATKSMSGRKIGLEAAKTVKKRK